MKLNGSCNSKAFRQQTPTCRAFGGKPIRGYVLSAAPEDPPSTVPKSNIHSNGPVQTQEPGTKAKPSGMLKDHRQ